MAELKSSEAVMNMTLHITRANTGLTETVEVVCTPIESTQGVPNGNDTSDSIS